MTDKRIIAEIERRIADCEASYQRALNVFARDAINDERATLQDFHSFILALPPDDLAAELADARDALEYSESKRQFEMRRAVEETKMALDYCGLEAELADAKVEIKRLREALEFYAEGKHVRFHPSMFSAADQVKTHEFVSPSLATEIEAGHKARAALAEGKA